METSRRCDGCNIAVHRHSHAKYLRIKKRLENVKKELFIPEWLFEEPI